MLTVPSCTNTATIIPFPVVHRLRPTPSGGIVGLVVNLAHRPCRACGSKNFAIGSSKAMHAARLTCTNCGTFGGWLSHGGYAFVSMAVERGEGV
jgi:hypothetical protein